MPSRGRNSIITPSRHSNTPQRRPSTATQRKPSITPIRVTESFSPDPLDLIDRVSSPDPLDLIERSPAHNTPQVYTPTPVIHRSVKGKRMVMKGRDEMAEDELDIVREKKRRRIMSEDSSGDDLIAGAVMNGVKLEKEVETAVLPTPDSSTLPIDDMEEDDQRGTLQRLDQELTTSPMVSTPPRLKVEPSTVLPFISAAEITTHNDTTATNLPTPPSSSAPAPNSDSIESKAVEEDQSSEHDVVVPSGLPTPPTTSELPVTHMGHLASSADNLDEELVIEDMKRNLPDVRSEVVDVDLKEDVDFKEDGLDHAYADDLKARDEAFEPEEVMYAVHGLEGRAENLSRAEVKEAGGRGDGIAKGEVDRPESGDHVTVVTEITQDAAELGQEAPLVHSDDVTRSGVIANNDLRSDDTTAGNSNAAVSSTPDPGPIAIPAEELIHAGANTPDIASAIIDGATMATPEVSLDAISHKPDTTRPYAPVEPGPAPVTVSVDPDEEGEEELEPELEVDALSEGQMDVASSPAIGTPQSSNKGKGVKAVTKGKKASAPAGKGKSKSSTAVAKSAGKKKTKVDTLKNASHRASSVTSSNTPAASSETRSHRDESVDPDDKAVYCICGKPYADEDEDVVMLGCDACDNWYHPACVGIPEERLELIETYICKSCERSTSQRTITKSACKRDGCHNSVAGKSSKYCSSSCAFRYMNALLGGQTNKKIIKQLSSTFLDYPRPTGAIQVVHHTQTDRIASQDLVGQSQELAGLDAQIVAVNTALEIVRKRQRMLARAMARCEDLKVDMGGGEEVGKKKGAKAVDDRACGWSRGLVWSDVEVEAWIEIDDGGAGGEAGLEDWTCMALRKRCDRHGGWQKTVPVSLDVEYGRLKQRLAILAKQRRQLDASVTNQRSVERIRNDVRKFLSPPNDMST